MDKNAIFVFGSNLGGFHGAGAAKFAKDYRGAILGQAIGLQGQSYAIPTKDRFIRETLALVEIQEYVNEFLQFAEKHQDKFQFQVTRIGCGLAGLKDENVAPMFKSALDNCWFDLAWKPWLGNQNYWGTK